MKCTTSSPSALESLGAGLIDLDALLHRLRSLSDSRHRRGLRYPLAELLLLVLLAKLSDQDQMSAIAEWIANRGLVINQAALMKAFRPTRKSPSVRYW